jgi:hypothetical protein
MIADVFRVGRHNGQALDDRRRGKNLSRNHQLSAAAQNPMRQRRYAHEIDGSNGRGSDPSGPAPAAFLWRYLLSTGSHTEISLYLP